MLLAEVLHYCCCCVLRAHLFFYINTNTGHRGHTAHSSGYSDSHRKQKELAGPEPESARACACLRPRRAPRTAVTAAQRRTRSTTPPAPQRRNRNPQDSRRQPSAAALPLCTLHCTLRSCIEPARCYGYLRLYGTAHCTHCALHYPTHYATLRIILPDTTLLQRHILAYETRAHAHDTPRATSKASAAPGAKTPGAARARQLHSQKAT